MVVKKVYVSFPLDTYYDGCVLIAADSLDEANEIMDERNKSKCDSLMSELEIVNGMTYEGDESMILIDGEKIMV